MAAHTDIEDEAARIAELVKHFEDSKDWETQAKVFEMLERIDLMHRACIWRLYEMTAELGGKGLVDRLQLDPMIKHLFILYDLLPPDSPHVVTEHQPHDFQEE